MSIAMLGHPFGAGQVTIEGTSCTIMFTIRVNVQHDPGNLAPVGSGRVGVEQTKVRNNVLLIVHRQRRVGRRRIVDIGIERRLLHWHPAQLRNGSSNKERHVRRLPKYFQGVVIFRPNLPRRDAPRAPPGLRTSVSPSLCSEAKNTIPAFSSAMHLTTHVLSHLEPTFGLQAFEGRWRDQGLVSDHLLRPAEKRTCGPHLAESDHAWITSAARARNALIRP